MSNKTYHINFTDELDKIRYTCTADTVQIPTAFIVDMHMYLSINDMRPCIHPTTLGYKNIVPVSSHQFLQFTLHYFSILIDRIVL